MNGTRRRHPDFPSRYVTPRHIDVWLPPGYGAGTGDRFPVLYMHDGQNLFDPKTSFIGVDWNLGETMTRLIGEGQIRPAIVVGIWNTPRRVQEYMPRKPLELPHGQPLRERLEQEWGGSALSDHYLKFLTEELMLFIDRTYRTLPEREHTYIMGSSMGGLISLYAVCEYPHLFAGAGCLSTHWPAGDGIVIDYLETALPKPGRHKFYFDHGTETLDACYEPYQQRVDAILGAAGYEPGRNWLTRKFAGAEHSERAWRERIPIPLTFLLGPEGSITLNAD